MSPETNHRDYDVIVGGGGIAGLSAGYFLNQAGMNTLLLEHKKHGGGRAHQIGRRRMGAEQMYGHNVQREMAAIGVSAPPVHSSETTDTFVSINGVILPTHLIFRKAGNGQSLIARDIIEEGRQYPENISLERFLQTSKAFRGLLGQQKAIIRTLLAGEFGADPEDLGIETMHDICAVDDIETCRIEGGFGVLVETLQKEQRVRFNESIRDIVVTTDGVCVRSEDGANYRAREMVAALPFESLATLPHLPDVHRNALRHLAGADVVKIFFDARRSGCLPKESGLVNTDGRNNAPQVLWKEGSEDPERWTVTAYMAGSAARKMAAVLSHNHTEAECYAKQKIELVLRGFADTVTGMDFSVWCGKQSAHSYIGPDPKARGVRKILATPWVDEKDNVRVSMAGEFCSVPGGATVLGAYRSGKDAAESVLRRHSETALQMKDAC